MLTSAPRSSPRYRLLIAFLVVLTAWKAVLWLHTPLPTTDGVQMLSHTFSVLRGDVLHSTYWHHWMAIYQLPYGFALFTAPLMGLLPFGVLHNYFAAMLIFAAITTILTVHWLASSSAPHARTFAALAGAAVFAHPQLWTLRPEVIALPLLLLALMIAAPRPRPLVIAALLTALAGLTQPLAGLIGVLVIGLHALECRWSLKALVAFGGLVAGWVALLYLPVILIDVPLWVENFIGFFTREEPRGVSTLGAALPNLTRAGAWMLPLIALYAAAALRSWRQPGFSPLREAIFLLVLLVPMVMGGMGYYYGYLILFVVWRLSRMPRLPALPMPAVTLIAALVPLFAFVVPTLQALENPRYGETIRAIYGYTQGYADRAESGTIWLSTQAGYPLIDEPYARVLANYVQLGRYDAPIPFEAGDEALWIWDYERDTLLRNYAVAPADVRVELIIEPVPGLLTAESVFRARQPAVGLWRAVRR